MVLTILCHFPGVAVQAGFDWVGHLSTSYVQVSVTPAECLENVDLIFLLDGSGSIDLEQFGGYPGVFTTKVLKFVADIVEYYVISPTNTRVSIVTFASSVTLNFNFAQYTTKEQLLTAIGIFIFFYTETFIFVSFSESILV